MSSIWVIAMKDVRLLLRDRGGLFFAFLLPVLMAVFFGVAYGAMSDRPRSLAVAVTAADGDPLAAALLRSEDLDAVAASVGEADELVRQGLRVAAVHIGRAADGHPTVELVADPSRLAEGAVLRGLLWSHAAASLPGHRPSFALTTRQVSMHGARPPTPFAISFPQGIIWGILGCAATFAVGLVQERTRGTLTRLRMAPLTRAQILGGKALACFLVMMAVQGLLLSLGALAFDVRPDHLGRLVVVMASVAGGFVGLMLGLSAFGRTERFASGLAWGGSAVMAMLGGGMLPLLLLPPWLQALGNVSPVKWATLALEGVLWRGSGWEQIAGPCAVLLLIGGSAFALGSRELREG